MPDQPVQKRERYALVVVIAIAAAVRVAYLLWYSSIPEWAALTVDNYYHHNWALDIAGGDFLGDTTYFRAPGYVWLLSLFYWLLGPSLWVGRLLGLTIGLGTVAVTYFLGRRLTGHWAGIIAASIYALYPLSYYFEMELLLDPLFCFLIAAAFLWYFRWRDSNRITDALFAGLLMGLAALTRPTALIFVPFIIVVLLFDRNSFDVRKRGALIWLLAVCIPIAVTFSRNIIVAGDAVPIASQAGINLYIGNNPSSDGISAVLPEPMGHNWQIRQVTDSAEKAAGETLTPGRVSDYWRSRAVDWMITHPSIFATHTLRKLYRQISNREVSNNRDLQSFSQGMPLFEYNPLGFGLIFALAVLGATKAFRERSSARIVVWLIILYAVSMSLFFFSSRFRLPMIPFYAVLAGYGVWAAMRPDKRRRWVTWIFPISLALVALVVSLAAPIAGSSTISSQYLTSKGHYHYAIGEMERALEEHYRAREIDSTFPENNMNVGVIYLRMGEADSARKYLEREIMLHPLRHKALTNLASLALVSGQPDTALVLVREALRRASYDITANALYLRCLLQLNAEYVDSLPIAIETAAIAADSNVHIFSDFGIILSNAGELVMARQALMIAAGSHPPPIETNDQAFQPNFADSDKQWVTAKGAVFSQLCFLSGTTERYRDAINFGKEAVRHNPELVDGYINLTSAYMAVNRRYEADSIATIALGRFPDNKTLQRLKHYAR